MNERATAPPVIGRRYVLTKELGRGGMGVVWLAEDRLIGRRVAVKQLHARTGLPVAKQEILEQRILREARAAGRLNHPSTVTVYDVVQEGGVTYIVMELVEGTTLSGLVAERGPLPPERVAQIAGQVLAALEAAHAQGIVHRDIKPSNIMMLPDGRVKLADFGIALLADDPSLTTTGAMVGSLAYLAPERIQGAEGAAASDLWALGAMLFFAVEGQSPVERDNAAATVHAILSTQPRCTRCDGTLGEVINGLLASRPEDRPNAVQVRAMLARNQPSPVPTAGPDPPNGGRVPRKLVLAVVAALVVVATSVAIAFATRKSGAANADSGQPAPTTAAQAPGQPPTESSSDPTGSARTAADFGVTVVNTPEQRPEISIADGSEPPPDLLIEDQYKGTGPEVGEGSDVRFYLQATSWSDRQDHSTGYIDATVDADYLSDGLRVGMAGMKEGGRRLVIVPPGMRDGQPGEVGPADTMVYVIGMNTVRS